MDSYRDFVVRLLAEVENVYYELDLAGTDFHIEYYCNGEGDVESCQNYKRLVPELRQRLGGLAEEAARLGLRRTTRELREAARELGEGTLRADTLLAVYGSLISDMAELLDAGAASATSPR